MVKRLSKNKKGQVAVEFLIMFTLVVFFIIYLFFFAITLAGVQVREYITFMTGRAATASAVDYKTKEELNIDTTFSKYAGSRSAKILFDTGTGAGFGTLYPSFRGGRHQRGVLQYAGGTPELGVVANAGVATKFSVATLLPTSSGEFNAVIESMTGSEMSDAHSECLLADFKNTWEDCLGENSPGSSGKSSFSDNK